MDTNQALMLLLKLLQEKYAHYTSIFSSTKELHKLALGDDQTAFGAQLNQRKSFMDAVDDIDRQIKDILARLPQPLQGRIRECLHPSAKQLTLDNPLQTNIFDTNKRNMQLLKRIVSADDELNKLANPQK